MRLSTLAKLVEQLTTTISEGGGGSPAPPEDVITPLFTNSWVATGGTNPGYYKANERVYLTGRLVKTILVGAPEIPFNLPEGYRPSESVLLPLWVNNNTTSSLVQDGQIMVQANGDVMIFGTIDGNDDIQISLDGINFRAAV